jgi:hypothetical protein
MGELRAFGLSAMFGLFAVLGLFMVALRPLNVLIIVLLVLYSSVEFVRGYAARKRRLASRLKLSAVVRRFLDGTGRERELENYAHGNLTPYEEEKFLNPLMTIGAKYTVGLTPGVYNEKARTELEALAASLERDGL